MAALDVGADSFSLSPCFALQTPSVSALSSQSAAKPAPLVEVSKFSGILIYTAISCLMCIQILYILLVLIALVDAVISLAHDISSGFFVNSNLILAIVAATGLGWLSFQEHRRSVRPSDLAILYLTASSVCDVIWWTLPSSLPKTYGMASELVAKLLLVILECCGKESILLDDYRKMSPEEYANVLSRTFFWWIHPVLIDGYHKILMSHELPITDHKLSSDTLRRHATRAWVDRPGAEFSLRSHYVTSNR